MSKIGPKELALKQLPKVAAERALSKAHEMMVADGLPPALARTTGKTHEQLVGKPRDKSDGVTLAPPVAVQKAIEKDLAEVIDIPVIAKDKPEPKQKEKVVSTKQKKTAKAKTSNGASKTTKTELIANLLKRKEGCTTADVLKATGWPAVSMPAVAKAAGLKLKKEKDGKITRYRAA